MITADTKSQLRKEKLIGESVKWLSRFRSLGSRIEYRSLDALAAIFPGTERVFTKRPDPTLEKEFTREALELIDRDAQLFASGRVPLALLLPDRLLSWPFDHSLMWLDGVRLYRRRAKRQAHDLPEQAKNFTTQDLPDYYQRNFHFQTDGYFSEFSARIYDHQVDLLFGALAEAMRRLLVDPALAAAPERGRGMRVLELGCGSGSATRLLAALMPEAEIVSLDLSESYLRLARKRLERQPNVQFYRANAENIPFLDQSFDLVISVFLFHELPSLARQNVLRESLRVLKPGAETMLVDSVQLHDSSPFTATLKDFPKGFHEPFFANYTQTPMEDLLLKAGFVLGELQFGLASKMLSARKPKL